MSNVVDRSSEFTQSIGVNAHLEDLSTSYGSVDVGSELQYLGVSNVRSTAPHANLPTYVALGQQGVKFDLISVNTNLSDEIGWINSLAGSVTSVEGPNEVNNSPVSYQGLSGPAAAIAYQADLYNAVHSDSLLSGVKVLPFSLSTGGSLSGYGDVSAYADEGNVHAYAGGGTPPYFMLGGSTAAVTTVSGKPEAMTETGYYTLQDGYAGVTQDVQAKWLMDTLLQNSVDGVAKTYLYELNDLANDPGNNDLSYHYGLFNTDGTPKQSATDIHNLTTILADNGPNAASFTPAASNFTVTGLPDNDGFDTVFAKSNGSYDVALWSEPTFYNEGSGAESAVTPSTVTVALGAAYDVNIYDPVLGTAAITSYANTTSVQVSLATDPLIVEVTPTAGTRPAASDSGPVSLGTGSDSIVVNLSEDAWAGDANFTVAVDGTHIGGVQAATAPHSLGQTQAFTLNGDFAPGSHTVTVNYLNDAFSRSATTDRNLYVDSISAGGVTTGYDASVPGSGYLTFTATELAASLPTIALGAGSSSIVLDISEDAWNGGAQFTVSVDGNQIGGVQTASALHGLGQTQGYALDGDFAAGTHSVAVSFINDYYGGTANTDRNLYVDSISAGGTTTPLNAALFGDGTQTFTAALSNTPSPSAAAVPSIPPATQATPVPDPTLGTGSSSIVVGVSEDAWKGDAQFTLAVDGQQIGGVQTASALHSLGQSQAYTLEGDFGAGAHTVTATFLNDAYGGTPAADRNLYVDSISADGSTIAVNAALLSNGSKDFAAPAISPANSSASSDASTAGQMKFITLGASSSNVTLTGSNTVQAGTGADLFNLAFGQGGTDIINGFKLATDQVHLSGYNLPDPAKSVTTAGANSVLSLGDGTNVTFVNTHGLTAANFV